ncbi:hypothetical protein J6590_040422 [Homalodisca vitripennis]|nr:hypothetical protein J6590_040422 [Homalodisca vitripennis]
MVYSELNTAFVTVQRVVILPPITEPISTADSCNMSLDTVLPTAFELCPLNCHRIHTYVNIIIICN